MERPEALAYSEGGAQAAELARGLWGLGAGAEPSGGYGQTSGPGEYGLSWESRAGPGAQEGKSSDRTEPSDCESKAPPSSHQVNVPEARWDLGPDRICPGPGVLGLIWWGAVIQR